MGAGRGPSGRVLSPCPFCGTHQGGWWERWNHLKGVHPGQARMLVLRVSLPWAAVLGVALTVGRSQAVALLVVAAALALSFWARLRMLKGMRERPRGYGRALTLAGLALLFLSLLLALLARF